MGELKPGARKFDDAFWKTVETEWSIRDILDQSSRLEKYFEGLQERSLIVIEGFDSLRTWCLALAAWRRDMAILPLMKGVPLPEIPWARHVRAGSPEPVVIDRTESYSHSCDLYILSSGSTGLPKAIGHTLAGLRASAEATLNFYQFKTGDRWLLSLDPSHIGGFQILMRTWIGGGVVAYSGGPREVERGILSLRPQYLSLVPTQVFHLLQRSGFEVHLREAKAIILGGAAVQVSLLNRLKGLGLPISISYGSTETASQITGFPPGVYPDDARNVGKVLPVWTLIEEEGELLISGLPLMAGYFQGRTWHQVPSRFPLPDRAYGHEGGLFIEGRRDQVFQIGGENTSPAEILSVLEPHYNLSDLLILKRSDPKFGHVPWLVLRSRVEPNLPLLLTYLEALKPRIRPREIWWFESEDVGKISQAQLEPLVVAEQLPLRRLWTYEKL